MVLRKFWERVTTEQQREYRGSRAPASIYVHSSAAAEPEIDDAALLEYYGRLERGEIAAAEPSQPEQEGLAQIARTAGEVALDRVEE